MTLGTPVSSHTPYLTVDLVLPLHPLNVNLQVELTHPADDDLTSL